jgi:PAS domain S-box-containing protein
MGALLLAGACYFAWDRAAHAQGSRGMLAAAARYAAFVEKNIQPGTVLPPHPASATSLVWTNPEAADRWRQASRGLDSGALGALKYAWLIPEGPAEGVWWRLGCEGEVFSARKFDPPPLLAALMEGKISSHLEQVTAERGKSISYTALWAPWHDAKGTPKAVVMLVQDGLKIPLSGLQVESLIFPISLALLLMLIAGGLTYILWRAGRDRAASRSRAGELGGRARFFEDQCRLLVEHSSDVVFSLDDQFRFLVANRALHEKLGLRPAHVKGKPFIDCVLHADTPMAQVAREEIQKRLQQTVAKKNRVVFNVELQHTMAAEARFFRLQFEYLPYGKSFEILGKASELWGSTMLSYVESEHQALCVDNSLIHAESISHLVTRNLLKYLPEEETTSLRIALREILINAIEHGNLAITFDEKTRALAEDRYFDLIRERRADPRYKARRIRIRYTLNAKVFTLRVRDEGGGFDHRRFLTEAARIQRQVLTHGRGIAMALSAFDEVHYNEAGNEVLLLKSMKNRLPINERLRLKILERLTDRDILHRERELRHQAVATLVIDHDWDGLGITSERLAPRGPRIATRPPPSPRGTLEPELEEIPLPTTASPLA